jgi:hypothetical protein
VKRLVSVTLVMVAIVLAAVAPSQGWGATRYSFGGGHPGGFAGDHPGAFHQGFGGHRDFLCDPDDLKAAIASVTLCREIGNSSAALRPFAKREVMPGNLKGAELENFVRDGVTTYWHQA